MCLVLLATAPGMAQAQTQAQSQTQDRPFLFSVSTPQTDVRHATVHVEAGFGERAFDLVEGDRPEQRIGLQATLGGGLTLLARVGVAADGSDTRSSQQAELLYSVVRGRASHGSTRGGPTNEGSLALGLGVRHESEGINVLLGRVAAGRRVADAWRLDGNVVFEKPFSTGRDAVDLLTSFGVARRLVSAVHVGVELIGEDLEGFWEEEEAEGGARLLVGPSLRIAPTTKSWQLSVAGGPIVHATRSGLTSDATRSLGGTSNGFAVRAALSYVF